MISNTKLNPASVKMLRYTYMHIYKGSSSKYQFLKHYLIFSVKYDILFLAINSMEEWLNCLLIYCLSSSQWSDLKAIYFTYHYFTNGLPTWAEQTKTHIYGQLSININSIAGLQCLNGYHPDKYGNAVRNLLVKIE